MKWILFDKDGTLIYFDESWNRIGMQLVDDFITEYRHDINDINEAYRALGIIEGKIQPGTVMASGSLQDIINAFNNLTNKNVSQWAQERSQALIDQRVPDNKRVEGVYSTLKTLKSRGYKLGIVTSDTKKGLDQFLKATETTQFFDVVIPTEAHAVEKPNPDVLKPLFDQFDVEPYEVMMVGDTPNDILTAINAKLGYSLAVLTGVGEKEDFDQANYIANDANEILTILDEVK
ncbi:HAD family hydrolase [Staphylococcus sp. SQ8-PEA]|uniref:HAD family hydrolase n=1 Tax=Staphylococcus marylandisciuri TaxID=2981529 RepID=A0ABT2QRM8_9STAP|nr:HAD family hydrolase [Staphylococcus marylandisciuri]MCU5746643.1 HAD family hydrolase [Staphylococcus marylandisciuri]